MQRVVSNSTHCYLVHQFHLRMLRHGWTEEPYDANLALLLVSSALGGHCVRALGEGTSCSPDARVWRP